MTQSIRLTRLVFCQMNMDAAAVIAAPTTAPIIAATVGLSYQFIYMYYSSLREHNCPANGLCWDSLAERLRQRLPNAGLDKHYLSLSMLAAFWVL